MIYFPLFIFEPVATNPTGQWVIPVDATGQNGVNGSFCIRLSTSTIETSRYRRTWAVWRPDHRGLGFVVFRAASVA